MCSTGMSDFEVGIIELMIRKIKRLVNVNLKSHLATSNGFYILLLSDFLETSYIIPRRFLHQ